ncbi:hypothetical protein Ga0061061_11739 [Chelatococcus sambhunathii]|uniref:Uncharacterized protein n=1 Tax=Chelatococcus sambhunathii TaxID=363953 RepID=A0ABM9U9H3_9HYPH|nr:hypothetical protein Ga0061061_11739 [Chelatococcus sambhunathii]
MCVVLIHKETGRFRATTGLCRGGWSNYIGFAKFYPDVEAAFADLPNDQRDRVRPAYVYLFDEPIGELAPAD